MDSGFSRHAFYDTNAFVSSQTIWNSIVSLSNVTIIIVNLNDGVTINSALIFRVSSTVLMQLNICDLPNSSFTN